MYVLYINVYLLGHPTPQVSEFRPLCSRNTNKQWRHVPLIERVRVQKRTESIKARRNKANENIFRTCAPDCPQGCRKKEILQSNIPAFRIEKQIMAVGGCCYYSLASHHEQQYSASGTFIINNDENSIESRMSATTWLHSFPYTFAPLADSKSLQRRHEACVYRTRWRKSIRERAVVVLLEECKGRRKKNRKQSRSKRTDRVPLTLLLFFASIHQPVSHLILISSEHTHALCLANHVYTC